MIEALALGAPGGFALTAAVSYLAPELVRRRGMLLRRLIAALAAAAAFAAGTEPTGVAVVDAVLAPAVVATVVLLAARARPSTVALVAGAGALASVTSPQPWVAFAAAGAALAMVLTARRTPVLTALVGAAVANAALRLRFEGPHGSEVVVAVALFATIAVSGYRRLRPTVRQRYNRAAFLAGGAVGVLGCLGLVALGVARPGLERGVDVASQALTAARLADPDRAGNRFEVAAAGFRRADRALGAWWAQPAKALPVLGPHLRALQAVAGTGADLSDTGRASAAAADLGGARVQDGEVPLERLAALAPPLAAASAEVSRALDRLREARSPWLVPPVAERLDSNLARLSGAERSLRTSSEVVRVLPAMLGANGPRRWFLALQTPSEARASGGFIGNFGEIVADGGRLDLARFGRITELNTGGGPGPRTLTGPADYVARYRRFNVATTWQNVTLSPHFPSVGEVIAELYPQSGGRPIDGVIAIDPTGLAALLRLTGPVSVALWPEPITADNAERILLFEQYVQLPGQERIDFLGDVTRALFDRLTTGELATLPQVLDALGPAVAGKHLLLTAVDDAEEAALDEAGANGAMAPVRGDALAVVTQNAAGNKIDWFLRRTVEYRPVVDPSSGQLSARLTITLENTAPSGGLPDFVIGNVLEPPRPKGTNRLYLSVYTPWGLVGARVDGVATTVESESEVGRRVYSSYLEVPPESRVVVEMDLEGFLPDAREGYRLDLHAQTLVQPEQVNVTVGDGRPQRVVLDRNRTVRATLD